MQIEKLQEKFLKGESIEFDTPTIVLGSKSPRRARAFEEHGINFVKLLSDFDDGAINDEYAHENISKRQEKEYAKAMSKRKLEPFIGKVKNGAVIVADTTVLCCGRVLEKPVTAEKCREQHEFISGKTAHVYTAISIYFNGKVAHAIHIIKRKFKIIPSEVIEEICKEPETLDCAGFWPKSAVKPYINITKKMSDDYIPPLVAKTVKKLGFPKENIFNNVKIKAEKLFKSVKTFILSCVDGDGYPMTKAVVPGKYRETINKMYFCTNTTSRFVGNVTKNPKASVYFYSRKLIWKGCALKGKMGIVSDTATKHKYWQNKYKNAYEEKSPNDPDFCVLEFTPFAGRYYSWFKIADFKVGEDGK